MEVDRVVGVNHDWRPVSWLSAYDGMPHLFASISTFAGSDPVSLRARDLQETGAELMVQEDTSADPETNHALESVDYLLIERGGPIHGSPIQW